MNLRFQMNVLAVPGFALAALMLADTASAQEYPRDKVELYKQFTPGEFGAGGGNDCWGYTSPSGREYALMGLDNRVGVVEITDPGNAEIIATIPHGSSTWADIKTYKDHCYVVTESNTGIQVISLADVDNGNVTLVRTIGTPSRSHNVVVNTESGYLFTVGSGRTYSVYLFDLEPANGRGASPGNPVFVESFPGNYLHDAQVLTYDKGEQNERQIVFGASEGRGLEIYELKFVNGQPSWRKLSAVSYPDVAYCHQVWLDADRHYAYVDDELDEQRHGIPTTRTLVFDVSDLNNPTFVSEFTSGETTIDHNLFVRDGFIFEGNYESGLRIFDANVDPLKPPHVGFFDTYPQGNSKNFNGMWGAYPFFASGTVIGSDRSRGLFILDVSEATGGGNIPSACCFARGSCKDLKPVRCRRRGGRSNFGKECDSFDCPRRGACCIDNSTCEKMLERDCLGQGGDFKGEGESCRLACPCDLIKRFKANCTGGGTIKATLTLKNKSRDGETVEFKVGEKLKFKVTIRGKKARLFTCCFNGPMEVSLIDPDGCVDSVKVDCPE